MAGLPALAPRVLLGCGPGLPRTEPVARNLHGLEELHEQLAQAMADREEFGEPSHSGVWARWP